MAITKEDILEAVGSLTVMELNDLVKVWRKVGVSAAAVAVAGPAGVSAADTEEKTEFEMSLWLLVNDQGGGVIKVIRAIT